MGWSVLKYALIGAAVAAVMGFLLRANARASNTDIARDNRIIRPGRVAYGAITSVSALIAVAALGSVLFFGSVWAQSEVRAGLLLGGAFAAFAWWMGAYLLPAFEVHWDDTSLTGPLSHRPPPFGPGRKTIAFADIARIGTDWTQSYCVRDRAGQRVRFSYLYPGFVALLEAIKAARPDLFPDAEE